MPVRHQIGDVVRNEIKWGTRRNSRFERCPGCTRFVSPGTSHCNNCKTTFVPLAEGFVQVVGVRESAPH